MKEAFEASVSGIRPSPKLFLHFATSAAQEVYRKVYSCDIILTSIAILSVNSATKTHDTKRTGQKSRRVRQAEWRTGLKIGVLLDEPTILTGFDSTFFAVKSSSGRILQPLPKAWNVVNCFADNTISQSRPELVATCNESRAVRGTPKRFLWDWICPSRSEYREYCLRAIQDIAEHDVAGIRLDSVCFPREGYCDCSTCRDLNEKSGESWLDWRAHQFESFICEVRENVACSLGLTLEPDPCYGKERFGLDVEKLSKYVDFISTPLYMDYSIVYWLDIIANCFRRKISKPYFIELYAGHPRAPTKHLVSALAVASKYADCLVLSTFESSIATNLQRELALDGQVVRFFEEQGCSEMVEVLNRWRLTI